MTNWRKLKLQLESKITLQDNKFITHLWLIIQHFFVRCYNCGTQSHAVEGLLRELYVFLETDPNLCLVQNMSFIFTQFYALLNKNLRYLARIYKYNYKKIFFRHLKYSFLHFSHELTQNVHHSISETNWLIWIFCIFFKRAIE